MNGMTISSVQSVKPSAITVAHAICAGGAHLGRIVRCLPRPFFRQLVDGLRGRLTMLTTSLHHVVHRHLGFSLRGRRLLALRTRLTRSLSQNSGAQQHGSANRPESNRSSCTRHGCLPLLGDACSSMATLTVLLARASIDEVSLILDSWWRLGSWCTCILLGML